jgi:alpha-L-rhamnosidase
LKRSNLRRNPNIVSEEQPPMPILTRTVLTRTVALTAALTLLVPGGAMADASPSVEVRELRTNSLAEPLAVPGRTPLLSWQLNADRRGVEQSRYEVHVASSPSRLDRPDVWDSGEVRSGQSLDIPYGGPALTAFTRYYWAVRVTDDDGRRSGWSRPATFETGPLAASDWTADWVGADTSIGPEWTDYTVDLDVTLAKDAFGVFFRGHGGIGYMWQLNELTRGEPKLRPHVRHPGGGYSVLEEIPLDGVDLYQRHRLTIAVSGSTITTSLDGTEVDSRTDGTHPGPGIIGFRTNGEEAGVVHRLSVTSADGTQLVNTDFPPGDDTFADGTVLPDGGLDVHGNTDLWLTDKGLPALRKDVSLPSAKITRARMYAAAQGVYELRLNGKPIGDQELAPGWTDYRKRIAYQAYDVTTLLRAGQNTLGAELAPGWFSGNVAMFGNNKYGDSTALVAQRRV